MAIRSTKKSDEQVNTLEKVIEVKSSGSFEMPDKKNSAEGVSTKTDIKEEIIENED